jgi:hypothetical protein
MSDVLRITDKGRVRTIALLRPEKKRSDTECVTQAVFMRPAADDARQWPFAP